MLRRSLRRRLRQRAAYWPTRQISTVALAALGVAVVAFAGMALGH